MSDLWSVDTSTHMMLVIGGGRLGTEVRRRTWPEGWQVVAIDQADLDLRDTAAIAARVAAGHDGRPFAAVANGAALPRSTRPRATSSRFGR